MAPQDEPVNDPLVPRETEVFQADLLATVGHELRGPLTCNGYYDHPFLKNDAP